MKEIKFGKNALIFSILTLFTVITWIVVEVYFTFKKMTIPKVTQEQMAPLDPKIKKEIIETLKENLWLSEENLNSNSISISEGTESAQQR